MLGDPNDDGILRNDSFDALLDYNEEMEGDASADADADADTDAGADADISGTECKWAKQVISQIPIKKVRSNEEAKNVLNGAMAILDHCYGLLDDTNGKVVTLRGRFLLAMSMQSSSMGLVYVGKQISIMPRKNRDWLGPQLARQVGGKKSDSASKVAGNKRPHTSLGK